MEKFMNSKVMQALQKWGQKLGSNKFVQALQAGMMSSMPILMVGAISMILATVGSSMLHLFEATSPIYAALYLPYQLTMNMIALWVVALISYNYARNLHLKNPLISMIEAMAVFFIIACPLTTSKEGVISMDITYLAAQGMFVGFVVSWAVVRIDKICADKHIYIKMPDMVPQFLQDGFAGIVPLLLNVIIFQTLSALVAIFTQGAFTICSGFMALLSAPLAALTSVPGIMLVAVFATFLWCFGIHGTMILQAIVMPLLLQAVSANAAAMAAGQPLQFYPVYIWVGICICGGTGNTWPFVLMSLRSKSEQMRSVAKAAAVPGWFGINEPATFGMPIMYNPILCIPYILSGVVIMLLTWGAYSIGFLVPAWIPITALLPMGFGSYLGTLSWHNAIWDYLMMIPAGIVWYPFMKAYEKQLVAKEQAALKEEQEKTEVQTA